MGPAGADLRWEASRRTCGAIRTCPLRDRGSDFGEDLRR